MGITYPELEREVNQEIDRMIATNGTFLYNLANRRWTPRQQIKWNVEELRELSDVENRIKVINLNPGESGFRQDPVYIHLKLMLSLNQGGYISPEEDSMRRLMTRTMTEDEYLLLMKKNL